MPRMYPMMTIDRVTNAKGIVLVSVFLVSSFCVVGLTWTALLGVSVVLTMRALNIVNDENDDNNERNSFESIYNDGNGDTSKQKRMLAKKKEKHNRRKLATTDDNIVVNDYQQTTLEESVMSQLLDYSMSGDFDADFTQNRSLSISDRINGSKTRVPSLRSPQPLISAVKSRVCRRDSERQDPLHPFGNSYSVSSPRRILRNVQNERPRTSLELSDGSILAKSPASGRYFSRINSEPSQNSILIGKMSPLLQPIQQQLQSEFTQIKGKPIEDPCSTAAVIKALQEKTASKRKRTVINQCETSFDTNEEFEYCNNKKRRLENVATTSAFNDSHPNNLKDYMKKRFISQSMLARPSIGSTVEDGIEKSKRESNEDVDEISKKKKVKYGLDDKEVEHLVDDDDQKMEIEGEAMKRKVRNHKEKANGNKTASKTSKSKQEKDILKKTPVKSVETQTPTKLVEEQEETNLSKNPKKPTKIKTPFKRIFTSGFPSNLKPGSTEKRRRIPIHCTFGSDLESVEIAREEFGERGVTYAAYQAEKEAAAKRANALLADDDDDDDGDDNRKEKNPATLDTLPSKAITTAATTFQHVTPLSSATNLPAYGNLTDAFKSNSVTAGESTGITSSAPSTGIFKLSSDKPSSQASNLNDSSNKGDSASTLINNNTKPMQALTTASQIIITNAFSSTNVSVSSTIFGNVLPATSGVSTQQSFVSPFSSIINTPSTAISGFTVKLNQTTSTTTNSQISAFNAFNSNSAAAKPDSFRFGSTASLPTAIPSVSVEKTQTSSGFSFTASVDSNQNAITGQLAAQAVSNTPKTKPDTAATTYSGFSFGTPAQSSSSTGFSFGNASISTNLLPNAISVPSESSIKPLTFNSLTSSTSSATVSNNAFSFVSTVSNQSVSAPATSSTSLPGGFSFGHSSAQPKSQTGFGGFSFGSSKTQSSFSFGTSAAVSSTMPQTQKAGFSFGKPSTENNQAFGSIFGSTANANTTTTPSIFGAQTSNIQGSTSIFGNLSQAPTTGSSLFGTTAATSGSVFGQPNQSVKTSALAFGTPSQSTAKSAPTFGTVNSSLASASAFGVQNQQPKSTNALFGASSSTNTFSFGAQNTNPFGSAVSQKPSVGGFSFTSTVPGNTSSSGTNAFGQPTANAATGFNFGQSNVNANPFGNQAAFGSNQPASKPTTTNSSFTFGQNTQQSFGQSSQSGFGVTGSQNPSGGFKFTDNLQTPASFSFKVGNGSSGGFSSRPGTPTPLAGNQPTVNPPGPLFGIAQPQAGGFTIGSSAIAGRQQIKGRRRARK